jgi:hypothetical protein
LKLAGGINRYGEANFRAVWGGSRLTWIGGRWEDRDAAGRVLREVIELRRVPKYAQTNRWHIERWCPPELYGSPTEWYARTVETEGGRRIPALGPYPERGEYELAFTLEGPRGEFVQLTPTIAEYVARAIEFGRRMSPGTLRQAVERRARSEENDYEQWAYDVLDGGIRAFGGQPFISIPR